MTYTSPSSGREYTVKFNASGYGRLGHYCSCPAWKFQHKDPKKRTCKHIKSILSVMRKASDRRAA